MGIYIPDKEVPISCKQCFLKDNWHDKCKLTGTNWNFTLKGRLPNCPLIKIATPHGNLIDEDSLREGIDKEYDIAMKLFSEPYKGLITSEYAHVEQEILETPIIIAAEEQNE